MLSTSPIDDLKIYARDTKSNNFEMYTLPFGENYYLASDLASAQYSTLYSEVCLEQPTDIRQVMLPSDMIPTLMSNLQIVALIRAARDLYQANIDVYAQVLAAIDAQTITTTNDIDTQWPILMAEYVKIRTVAPLNAVLEQTKADKQIASGI